VLSAAVFFYRIDIAGLVPASRHKQCWTDGFQGGRVRWGDSQETLIIGKLNLSLLWE
jgi:hypothetical protein